MKTIKEWRGIRDCPVCKGDHEAMSGLYYEELEPVGLEDNPDIKIYFEDGYLGYYRHTNKSETGR